MHTDKRKPPLDKRKYDRFCYLYLESNHRTHRMRCDDAVKKLAGEGTATTYMNIQRWQHRNKPARSLAALQAEWDLCHSVLVSTNEEIRQSLEASTRMLVTSAHDMLVIFATLMSRLKRRIQENEDDSQLLDLIEDFKGLMSSARGVGDFVTGTNNNIIAMAEAEILGFDD